VLTSKRVGITESTVKKLCYNITYEKPKKKHLLQDIFLKSLFMNKSIEKRLLQAEQLCKQAGVRLTDIRKDLLALIYAHGEHLTAYELLRLLRKTYPKAEAMTVYRGLDFLQKQHFIHRVASQNAYTGCDTPEHSHHAQLLLCEKCGQAEEINAVSLEKALQTMAKQYRFALSNNPMEITGTCKNCIG